VTVRKIWDRFPVPHPTTGITFWITVNTMCYPMIIVEAVHRETQKHETAIEFIDIYDIENEPTTIKFRNFGFEIYIRIKEGK